MRWLEYLIWVAVFLTGVLFALLNAEVVEVRYYLGSIHWPLSLVLGCTLLVGCVLGLFSSGVLYWRVRLDNRRLRRQVKLIEQEVQNLRAIPIRDQH